MEGRGWVKCFELAPEDLLRSHDGHLLPVESVKDRGEIATVYNLRIVEYHTYYVGDPLWGFSVWSHNANCNLNSNDAVSEFGVYEIKVFGNSFKIGKADLARVTQSSGLPTRLHQQLRKLRTIFGADSVVGRVVENLGTTTTLDAKLAETARLQRYYDKFRWVPLGNWKSFKPRLP